MTNFDLAKLQMNKNDFRMILVGTEPAIKCHFCIYNNSDCINDSFNKCRNGIDVWLDEEVDL